jgi:hypothetical protein
MKLKLTLASLIVALVATSVIAAPPSGQADPTISVICVGTSCITGGQIRITGENYPVTVVVQVIGPDGVDIDGGRYHTQDITDPDGTIHQNVLTAYQTPGLDGTWTVNILKGKKVIATTTFTCVPNS